MDKQVYQTPELQKIGTVEELTQGVTPIEISGEPVTAE